MKSQTITTLAGGMLGLMLSLTQAQAQAGRQQLGIDILNNNNISLYTGFGTANSHSLANIQDTAACRAAHTSDYSDVGDTQVWLHTGMLSAMKSLATTYGYTYRVTAIAGGDHSSNSRHYKGTAMDVDLINGVEVAAGAAYWSTFLSRCGTMGATERLGPGDAGHSTHIHAGWPTGTSASNAGGCNPPPVDVVTPSFITRTDGKMAAFGITTAGAIQYRMKDSIGAAWGSWVNLGGTSYSHMRALANDTGGMAVFGISGSTSTVSYRYLATGGSGIWSDWIALGGTSFYRVAPIMKTDGKMAVVGNGKNGTVFYREQTAVGPGASWSGWTELPANAVWEIDALPLPNGGAAAFMVGANGPVWSNIKSSSTASWTGWSNLGGSGFSRISAVMGTTGKMAFFGSSDGTGSSIFYQEQTAVGAGAGWTGWVSLGGGGYSSISGVALPNGGLAVFGCTDNSNGSSVFYQRRPSDTSAWSGYIELSATNVRRVAATVNAGLMSVSMRGGSGSSLWERPQTDSSHWAAWQNLGGTLK